MTLLAACESHPATHASRPAGPPATTPSAAPAARLPAPPADTPPADTLPAAGGAAEAGDVPPLHTPYTETKTVAPGLQVVISSVPMPATAVIHEPSELRLVLTIRRHGQVVFRDTTDDGLAYEYSEPLTGKLYPLWIPAGPGAGQLLVPYSGRPSKDRVRCFHLQGNRVAALDTLPTFDAPARNLDQDPWPEYGGLSDYSEGLSDDQGNSLNVYNPVLYYEVRPTGLVFDSVLTRRQAVARYGSFHGFKYSDKLTFPAPKP